MEGEGRSEGKEVSFVPSFDVFSSFLLSRSSSSSSRPLLPPERDTRTDLEVTRIHNHQAQSVEDESRHVHDHDG